MFYISKISAEKPLEFKTDLQKKVYETLEELNISYERADTDEAITMDDCTLINEKLGINMVKTLFLCNRQQTEFFLFVTKGDKPFSSKNFKNAVESSRVSFAPADLMLKMLNTKIGAATVFSALIDTENKVKIVIDAEVANEKYYGCSDGTTTGYMKLLTEDIITKVLPFCGHNPIIAEVKS